MVVASGDVRLPRFRRREAGAEVDRLYRRHADEVLRYALMVLRSRADAEDIVQIVFVRALRAIERGEKVRTPRNWLIKIAHNECRRLLSSRKMHAELPEEIAVEPIETGRVAELRTAMAALPEMQRQALVLRELEGRTYVEIATTLGLTVSAVETLIFRARRTLREQIEASMSCEDFALLLDDPDARSRIRAHARICPECATLERQARGRKSALKRIASMLGLPWWGSKLAVVGLTAATAAGVVASVAVTSHPSHPVPRSKAGVTVSTQLGVSHRPVVAHTLRVPGTPQRVSGTRATHRKASNVSPAPSSAASVFLPAALATTSTPAPQPPDPQQPSGDPLPPAAATPTVPALKRPPVPVATPHGPPVATPPVSVPAVTTPPVTVPVATPTVPAVTVPVTVQTPTVPAVTVTTPAVTITTPKVSLP